MKTYQKTLFQEEARFVDGCCGIGPRQDYLVFLAANASGDGRSVVGTALPTSGPGLALEAMRRSW